jgi:hypothetical protein
MLHGINSQPEIGLSRNFSERDRTVARLGKGTASRLGGDLNIDLGEGIHFHVPNFSPAMRIKFFGII